MKKAKCIQGFTLKKCDDEGRTLEREPFVVEENSIWDIEEDSFRVIGGEIRLTNDNTWIEVSEETLNECFEIIG